MALTCIVVDDEFLARQLLEGYIQKIPFLELAASCESAVEAMTILQNEKIDLIFLDVNMPEVNGINFIRSLKSKPEIIMTTAYSEHALEGYQLDVIEYLLKPIYFDRFLQAANKAKEVVTLKAYAKSAPVTRSDDNSFFVKTGPQKVLKINLEDIIYIESMHEYVRIHVKDGSYVVYHSLKGMLEILPLSQFVQIHRSYIVNFKRVTEIEGNIVKLDTIGLNIGKNFRDDFIARVRSNSI